MKWQNPHKFAEIMKKKKGGGVGTFQSLSSVFNFPKILVLLRVVYLKKSDVWKSKKLIFEYDTAIKMV